MWSLQLPDSWGEALYADSVKLELAGLFKHPLSAFDPEMTMSVTEIGKSNQSVPKALGGFEKSFHQVPARRVQPNRSKPIAAFVAGWVWALAPRGSWHRYLRSWQPANNQPQPVRRRSAHQFWSGKSDGLTGKNSAELHRMKSFSAWRIISLESWRPGSSSG